MKLTVHLVTWNGAKYIPFLFDSLRKQIFRDWSLYIVENNSKDETAALIKKELENFSVPHTFVENETNLGFAPGHNTAYRETNGEYFLLLNQDMYLQPDCLEKMVKYLDDHPTVGAVSPRLMKWDFNKIFESGLDKSFSNQIDALGLKIFRNRRVIEQYTQQDWNKIRLDSRFHGNDSLQVFGISGAFPMYRRTAIDSVKFSDGDFLDGTYHSYKEDVDLAYRLLAAGFESYILLDTVAYHDRAGAGPKSMDDQSALNNKKKQSPWVQYHSYKNHLRTLYKNEYWQNFTLDFLWILWYELKKFVYFLLFDRKVLTGIKEMWSGRSDLKDKRIQVNKIKKVGYRVLRKWF